MINQKRDKAAGNAVDPSDLAVRVNLLNLPKPVVKNPRHERKDYLSPVLAHTSLCVNLPRPKEKGAVNTRRLVYKVVINNFSALDIFDDRSISSAGKN